MVPGEEAEGGETTVKAYKSLIDECLDSECPSGHWCILKELVAASNKLDPRFLVQMKCVEIYKWDLGKEFDRAVGWEEALQLWASNGYAAKFARVYEADPDKHPIKMYEAIKRKEEK